MYLFISGNIAIKKLDPAHYNLIHKVVVEHGVEKVFVGDAYGVDSLIHKMDLPIVVFTVGDKPRNNNNHEYISVPAKGYGRARQEYKDRAMAELCHIHIGFVTGNYMNSGTYKNHMYVRSLNKESELIVV